MSKIAKMVLALFLALTLSFAIFGCDEGGGDGLTQEDIEQIVADAATTNAEVNTVKFDMEMQMAMETATADETIHVTMVADGTGAIDKTGKEMQIIMNMSMDMPEMGKQKMATEIYATGGWMYMKIGIPGLGEQWLKMPLTEEMWQRQSQFDQQVELLKTATEVNFLGSENVNGTDCYVVEIVPDMSVLLNLAFQQQMPGMEGLDMGGLNLADMFKEVSVKVWLDKDSYLEMKAEIYMLMEISAADIGAPEGELEKMTMDMNMAMILYDYNEAVSIELPEGAQQATEMTGM